ncbi:hypothetical protein AYK21_02585 [Thermoplasmatales archaeon SG8-52-2]|nr:MAG: hypothetical protein AYK21_02585 [Thermoplasmatales archaeon SG8-52-2]
MLKKILTIGIILLFIGTGIQTVYAVTQDEVKQSLNNKQTEFLSLFYGDLWRHVEKPSLNGFGCGGGSVTYASYHYLDADLDELKIELILNYTAEMNYTLKLPFYFAPIFAFGIEIQNITDCEWEYFKLKHHGYYKKTGNFSIVFNVDMTSIESGDEIIIQPIIYSFTIPYTAFPDKTNKSLIIFIRLIYLIPILKDLFLSNWLFEILGNYGRNNLFSAPLFLYFE